MSKWFDEKEKKRLLTGLIALIGAGIIVLCFIHIKDIFSFALGFVGWIWNVLSGFIAGFVLAYLLLPVVSMLQKLIMKAGPFKNKENAARGAAIASTYILIFLAVFGVLSAIVVAITKQVQTINFEDMPVLFSKLQLQVTGFFETMIAYLEEHGIATDGMREWMDGIGENLTGNMAQMGSGVSSIVGNVTGFFSNAIFAVIFSIYFLIETDGLLAYWSNAFKAILGKRIHSELAVLIADADRCFSGYIRGQLADAAFMGFAVSIVLSLIGVPYSLVIGISSGIGNLIPYVGPLVAYGMTIGVCVAFKKWSLLVLALVLVFVLQTIDGNIVNPKLLSKSIDVHPVLVIVGLLFGSAAGGLFGMLLAVPVASFLKLQFERFIRWKAVRCDKGLENSEEAFDRN